MWRCCLQERDRLPHRPEPLVGLVFHRKHSLVHYKRELFGLERRYRVEIPTAYCGRSP